MLLINSNVTGRDVQGGNKSLLIKMQAWKVGEW